jgi:hypothetical protein
MMSFSKKIGFCGCILLSSLLFLSSCGGAITDNTKPINNQELETILSASPELLTNSDGIAVITTTKDWSYDEGNHDLKIKGYNSNPEAQVGLTSIDNRTTIQIIFNGVPLLEDPKSSNPIIQHPLARFAREEGYAAKNKLMVNGKPYSGIIEGIVEADGKKITVFEMTVSSGRPSGTITAVSNTGKLYEAEGIKVIDIGNTSRKPVVYLYPTQETSVNVRVNFKGHLTHTYPKYNPAQGWTVTAKPDGELTDNKTGKIYYNLFWEGTSQYQYNLNTGFVVKGEDVADFLDASLEKLGLNRREANEFITYWLPEMEQNKYNLVHFSTSEYQAQAPLDVSPKPDTEIRVFMVYQPLDAPINVQPQTLSSPARKGFTLVEWGGKIQMPQDLVAK